MTIGVLALVGVTPDRLAALTAAGYAVREGKKSTNRRDAVRAAGETVRAVLTNGCTSSRSLPVDFFRRTATTGRSRTFQLQTASTVRPAFCTTLISSGRV